MRYEVLIDTVSDIVKTYGVGILSDPKFWNILSDTYSFAGEYSLRDSFKRCISEGFIADVVSFKGKRKKTITKIDKCISQLYTNFNSSKIETSAILFSIAISIGTCKKEDYIEYLNGKNPGKPITPPKSNTSASDKIFHTIRKNFLLLLFGLISTILGNLLYGLYFFCESWLFFVLIIIAIPQLCYCFYSSHLFEQAKSNIRQAEIASLSLPFYFTFFINLIASLFFQNENIRRYIYKLFSDWTPQFVETNTTTLSLDNVYYFPGYLHESPSFISIGLCIFLMLCYAGCVLEMFNHKNFKALLRLKEILISISILLLIGGGIFAYPSVKHAIQRSRYNNEQSLINKELELQKDANNNLIKSRSAIIQDLSFKGIRLGISFETAKGYAEDIQKSMSQSEIGQNNINEKYFYTYFRQEPDIMETLTQTYTSYELKDEDDHEWFCGKLFQFEATLDNQDVNINIFERDGLVYAIAITPTETLSHYGDVQNFSELVNLYTKKYGEPELIRERSYYEHPEYTSSGDTKYNWTFKNGTIRLCEDYITYVSSDFFELAKRFEERKQEEYDAEERARKYREFQQDSIEKAAHRADSIRRIRNHQNTINEI